MFKSFILNVSKLSHISRHICSSQWIFPISRHLNWIHFWQCAVFARGLREAASKLRLWCRPLKSWHDERGWKGWDSPGPAYSRGPELKISMKKRDNSWARIILSADPYNFHPAFPSTLAFLSTALHIYKSALPCGPIPALAEEMDNLDYTFEIYITYMWHTCISVEYIQFGVARTFYLLSSVYLTQKEQLWSTIALLIIVECSPNFPVWCNLEWN